MVPAIVVGILGMGLFGASTFAFVRLNQPSGGMSWPSGAPQLAFTVHADGSDDIADGSDALAVRLAFKAWTDIPDAGIVFYEDAAHASRPITDYTDNNVHLVFFDEANTTGYFGSTSSGLVAITPVEFVGNQIIDADIIFNGRDWRYSTHSVNNGGNTFDIQSIATHEVGHLLGLDHSPVWGATMVPFTYAGTTSQRSLEHDDQAGVIALYPSAAGRAKITGKWNEPNGSPLRYGHVVAVDQDGIVASTTLTTSDGTFQLQSLPFGTYQIYVEPLNGPIVHNQFYGVPTPSLAFVTTFFGGNSSPDDIFLAAGETKNLGTLTAFPEPAGTKINLTSINQGSLAPGNIGKTIAISLGGVGLGPSLQLIVGNDDIEITSSVFTSSSVTATLFIPNFVKPGLRSVIVRDLEGTNLGVLTGCFEVTRPAPTVSSVDPSTGPTTGGTLVTIDGDDFVLGAKVLFGSQEGTNVAFASATRLQVTAPSHDAGSVPVTVLNPDGQSRNFNSYAYVGSNPAPSNPTPSNPTPPSNNTPPPSSSPSQPSNPSGPTAGGGGGGGGGGCAVVTPSVTGWGAGLLLLAVLALSRRRLVPQTA